MKKVSVLFFLSMLFLAVFSFNSVSAQSNDSKVEPDLSDVEATFDLEKREKQESEVELPNGEKMTVGIEPVETISLMGTSTVSAGTYTWRVYYDTGSLASEFYARIYVPSSGYSKITSVYGARPIRIIGGTVSSEDLVTVRTTQTASLPAHAYYKIVTSWYNNWGSSIPTLHLKVRGKQITTEAQGFFF